MLSNCMMRVCKAEETVIRKTGVISPDFFVRIFQGRHKMGVGEKDKITPDMIEWVVSDEKVASR